MAAASSNITFVLGSKLPWISECVEAVLHHAPGGSPKQDKETALRRATINAFVTALRELWCSAFGDECVTARKVIADKLRREIVVHFNADKHRSGDTVSRRARVRQWRRNHNIIFNCLRSDIDPTNFEHDERVFYANQQLPHRPGCVTDKVDDDYTPPPVVSKDAMTYADAATDTRDEQRLLRSGFTRDQVSRETQMESADIVHSLQPPIRTGSRKCTDRSKIAIAAVSTRCGISVQKARVAVQATCEHMYGHKYLIEKANSVVDEPPTKRAQSAWPLVSAADYVDYKFILLSTRTVTDFKLSLAAQEEANAAQALRDLADDVRVTVHYDTTTRNNIDGEWPSLILVFSDARRFRLRPLFFAYEDRQNIVRLFVETFERLAAAASVSSTDVVTAHTLWSRVSNVMTDAASKNLGFEKEVSAALQTDHVPHHLLCKAHTVEALDASNLRVLSSVEQQVKLRQKIEAIDPSLRSFFRGRPAVVVAGIVALLKLITHDKSAASTSLADEFDLLCESEGVVKHMALYHERRFTKLGYACASLVKAMPLLRKLVAETTRKNLLVKACNLYLECEVFETELRVLAYFTRMVTLPLLNCIEQCSQVDLLKLLPQLHADLAEGKMDTLQQWQVSYRHVSVEPPTTDLEIELMNRMCADASRTVKLQCGREYGFTDDAPPRATQLDLLPEQELAKMPTHNIDAERDLAKFSHLAVVAKFRNKKFSAKGIRTDMTLYQSDVQTVNRITIAIKSILAKREASWTASQRVLLRERLQRKLAATKNQRDYVRHLLVECRRWGGPCSTVDELLAALRSNPDNDERIVRTELAFYKHSHSVDVAARPELFKLVRVSHTERLENLCVLLSDDSHKTSNSASIADLPTNTELAATLLQRPVEAVPSDGATGTYTPELMVLSVIMWEITEDSVAWFLCYPREVREDGDVVVEHLERVVKTSDRLWRHPIVEDVQVARPGQFIQCPVEGEWLYADPRSIRYNLRNCEFVAKAFAATCARFS